MAQPWYSPFLAHWMQKLTPASNASSQPPAEVRDLRKVYGEVAAVDGISFTLGHGSITALLGGNGAGKTTTIAMLMGLVIPTSGQARVFGADMARERHSVLHRMNFESPYVDVPMRLTVRQNLEIFARLYGVRDLAGPRRRARRRPAADRSARSPLRQAVGRAEDARQPGQGAAQRARAAAAGRADRIARSRHRRLGALQARELLQRAGRHRRARLAQHGRGRAPRRSGHHAGEGTHHRRRDSRRADPALRPRYAGGGVPRHRRRGSESAELGS